MTGAACSRLCLDFEMPFAGVIYRQYCLCASQQDFAGRRVTRIESQECDVNPNIRFFGPKKGDSTTGTLSPVQAKITASSDRAFLDETITFDVSVVEAESGKLEGLEFQVDFDDGSSVTQWSDKRRVEHTFRIPGHFVVKVHVRQSKKPDFLIAGSSTIVSIGQKLEDSEVNFTCRQLIEPGDESGCNITLYAGQDLGLEVDFGDGSDAFIFNASGESISRECACLAYRAASESWTAACSEPEFCSLITKDGLTLFRREISCCSLSCDQMHDNVSCSLFRLLFQSCARDAVSAFKGGFPL